MQSSVWLHTAWRLGFPLFVVAYALMEDAAPGSARWHGSARRAIGTAIGLTLALVAIVVVVCMRRAAAAPPDAGHRQAGAVMDGRWRSARCGQCRRSIVLWGRRQSMLDLWLLVVMCLFVIEIPLSYYPTPIRFSLAFLYGPHPRHGVQHPRARRAALRSRNPVREASRGCPGAAARATGPARDRRRSGGDGGPRGQELLTAMVTSADAGLRLLDRSVPDLERAKAAFRRISADGHRANEVVGASAPCSRTRCDRWSRSM